MIDSVAFCAPRVPPDTGASRKSSPAASSSAAMRRVATAEIVLWSMHTAPPGLPRGAPWMTPSGPSSTASTSAVEVTLVKMASASRAASAGEAHGSAPRARACSAASGRRT